MSGHSAPLGCALAYASQCLRLEVERVELHGGGGSGLVPEEAPLIFPASLLSLVYPILLLSERVLELELEQISGSANLHIRRIPSPQHHPSFLLLPLREEEEEQEEGVFGQLTCSPQRYLAWTRDHPAGLNIRLARRCNTARLWFR